MEKTYRPPQLVEYGSVLELVHSIDPSKGHDILEGGAKWIYVQIDPVPAP